MAASQWIRVLVVARGLALVSGQAAWAQVAPDRLAAVKASLLPVKAFVQRLPETARQRLSSGALNMIHLAEHWDQIESGLRQAPAGLGRLRGPLPLPHVGEAAPRASIRGFRPVSDPSLDLAFSRFLGFSQSETSTAWCGNTVLVGFNDSGSVAESLLFGPGGLSFNGVARSTEKGASFTDLGFLNPGRNPFDLLAGDPVLACADQHTFYYASLFERAFTSDISISKSTHGGLLFGNPISAIGKDNTTHFLDKEWMAIDPTNPSRIYITYTDFDASAGLCGLDAHGQPIIRTAIELVRSTGGGTSWTFPVVLAEVCGGPPFVQGSQVAVGPSGEVYVAWEAFAADLVSREIDLRKSTDHGATFGDPVKVDAVTCVGDCSRLQGNFRSQEFPSLAVDRSGTAPDGTLYVAWNDGRNLTVPGDSSGAYGFADVLLSRSTDGGATWSRPVRVNDDPLDPDLGKDHYQPGIAVDRTGKVGVCFYDRRRDPNNFLIDRFCAISTNAGRKWTNKRVTQKSFAPVHRRIC